MEDQPMLYDRVGEEFFTRLVDAFYDGVTGDALLAPMYPDYPDLGPARERLRLFLIQYWGGPHTYLEQRGHPRLRMRHMPFTVGERERDRWLVHMAAAVQSVCEGLNDGAAVAEELLGYFVPAADHLRNDMPLGLQP